MRVTTIVLQEFTSAAHVWKQTYILPNVDMHVFKATVALQKHNQDIVCYMK